MNLIHGGTTLLDARAIIRKSEVKASFTVADLGCGGGGHFVGPLASVIGNGTLYALDVQKSVLQSVESKLKIQKVENVQFIWSDLEHFGAAAIPNESCDVVLLVNVLFQNTNHGVIMKEATRFLKKGGKLVVIDWKAHASPFGPPVERRIGEQKVKFLAFEQGLRFFNEFDPGKYHYALVFRKEDE